MINSLLQAFFNIIFFILRWIANLILLPITALLKLFPEFNNFVSYVITFLDDYLFRGITFCKQVFINLTGFPQEIITITVDFTIILVGTIVTYKSLAFIVNVWRLFKGGGSSD